MSTTEDEYMTVVEATKEALWLKSLYSELCGIKSCITIHDNPIDMMTKHVLVAKFELSWCYSLAPTVKLI
jgi:hypothetical protein